MLNLDIFLSLKGDLLLKILNYIFYLFYIKYCHLFLFADKGIRNHPQNRSSFDNFKKLCKYYMLSNYIFKLLHEKKFQFIWKNELFRNSQAFY